MCTYCVLSDICFSRRTNFAKPLSLIASVLYAEYDSASNVRRWRRFGERQWRRWFFEIFWAYIYSRDRNDDRKTLGRHLQLAGGRRGGGCLRSLSLCTLVCMRCADWDHFLGLRLYLNASVIFCRVKCRIETIFWLWRVWNVGLAVCVCRVQSKKPL